MQHIHSPAYLTSFVYITKANPTITPTTLNTPAPIFGAAVPVNGANGVPPLFPLTLVELAPTAPTLLSGATPALLAHVAVLTPVALDTEIAVAMDLTVEVDVTRLVEDTGVAIDAREIVEIAMEES